ncbi:SigE family RNA polymerase sigma factor [Actinocorallia sp. A-T 12471]|uniref:SigE family RNA polymerase sigma factor n=1 Tax=Actinocorallia sp. A-T 12471 TaxID=3089813 RepID=UPI0029D40B88|nr:SigE family RNA polymerase sigma factor [Actinocorallia sp. A-T 12471]MDX6745047.1 SigE family RNA polymerase sigma factor [Actinocorallia sp. A-T 12471]
MRSGDPDRQFDEFVAHRFPALYRYAYVLTGNQHDAEDLVQEALTRTGVAWSRIRRKDDPEGYVRTTMARIMANRWRRPKLEHLVPGVPETAVDDPGLDRVHEVDGLDAALQALPPRMRAVLVLRYFEQLSEEETARALGCSRGTVKSQASRALAKLRAGMLDDPERALMEDRRGRS